LIGSVLTLVQMPLQLTSGAWHVVEHWPLTQTWPGRQKVPQPPQFIASAEVSTHAPKQLVVPGGQPHAPLMHTSPGGHT
jgi:hypothetical protein